MVSEFEVLFSQILLLFFCAQISMVFEYRHASPSQTHQALRGVPRKLFPNVVLPVLIIPTQCMHELMSSGAKIPSPFRPLSLIRYVRFAASGRNCMPPGTLPFVNHPPLDRFADFSNK